MDKYLRANTDYSPAGTYHLLTSEAPPPEPIVQREIILRILRFVSPHPWGSPMAEAGRNSKRTEVIAEALWPKVEVLPYVSSPPTLTYR